ncbi:MAG: T9SS type A sorting domain-containing protein [Chitinophagales bacterium]|nr:T9SS type A sorting domain-containing protein [Chitinophagales bacterium]
MQKLVKLFIAFSVLFPMAIQHSLAQCVPSLSACTLQVATDPLCMIPDSNEMSPALVNEPYDRHIHFIFENSITVSSNPQTGQPLPFPVTAMLEYMVFDSIGGLPPGITYEMYSGNPSDTPGMFSPANSNKAFGCIHLYGLPTEANTSATNGATIYTKPHGCVLGGVLCGDFPWPVIYRVPIEETLSTSSIQPVKNISVIPHVQSKKIQVDFQAVTGCLSEFLIIDLTGRTILNSSLLIQPGRNQTILDFSNPTGVYMLQVITPNGISTKRFIW